jgi:hypothetical protein
LRAQATQALSDPAQVAATSNGPEQVAATSNGPAQVAATSNDPAQEAATSNGPAEMAIDPAADLWAICDRAAAPAVRRHGPRQDPEVASRAPFPATDQALAEGATRPFPSPVTGLASAAIVPVWEAEIVRVTVAIAQE